jgi:predicted protein tyrosine phosphatase
MTIDDDSTGDTTRRVRTVPRDVDPEKFPQALAARIGDRKLWIANSGAVESNHLSAMDLDPEYVVSVNKNETWATTDHHPLKDGFVNDQAEFSAAVETTREHIRADGTVIVNCAAGISRSSTVIATALAAEEERSFAAAVEEINETRPRARPHPKLKLNAFAYLVNVENRTEARRQLQSLADSTPLRSRDGDITEELLSTEST